MGPRNRAAIGGGGFPRHRGTAGEEIHVGVAVGSARGFQVVRLAEEAAVRHGRRAAPAARLDVIHLHRNRGRRGRQLIAFIPPFPVMP